MKLARFDAGQGPRLGAVAGEEIADLSAVGLAPDVGALLAADAGWRSRADAALARAPRVALSRVRLLAPLARPPKFLGIGLNYAAHAREGGRELPKVPAVFNKQSTCVSGPFDDVHIPRAAPSMVDYEGELGVVIGRRCRHVPRDSALECVAGYLVVNDVTARDWQARSPTWTMGKSFDTHGPIGPWLTTADEVDDPQMLAIRTWVNGELRQDANTSGMVFDCAALIAHLTEAFTLEPGDIIATGTPSGVGVSMKPPRFLRPGDTVRIEIGLLGAIENRFVQEPETTARL